MIVAERRYFVCNGGNAKGVLMKAERLISKYGNEYLGYILWFDNDKYFPSQDANLKNHLEAKHNVEIYMSEPCVEHWLLAHFQTINLSIEEKNCLNFGHPSIISKK